MLWQTQQQGTLYTPQCTVGKSSQDLCHTLVTPSDIAKDLLTQAIIYLWTIFTLAHPCRIPLWTPQTNDGPLYSTRKGLPTLLNNTNPKEKQCLYFTNGLLIALSWREKFSKNPFVHAINWGFNRDGQPQTATWQHQLLYPVSVYYQHRSGVDLLG